MKKAAPKRAQKTAARTDFDELNDKLDLVSDTMATKEDLIALETRMERKIDSVAENHTKKFQEILTCIKLEVA